MLRLIRRQDIYIQYNYFFYVYVFERMHHCTVPPPLVLLFATHLKCTTKFRKIFTLMYNLFCTQLSTCIYRRQRQ